MPYKIRKQKCRQSDGDAGSYVLSYTDKSGKKHRACHTSKKKAQGQIAAIEGPWESDQRGISTLEGEELIREMIREIILEKKKLIEAAQVDTTKKLADRVTNELLSASPSLLKLGRRENGVNRLYPTSDKITQKQFADIIRKTFGTEVLEVQPRGEFQGFVNPSGAFPVFLFSPQPGDPALVPIMLAAGQNRGEAYEQSVVTALKAVAGGEPASPTVLRLINDIDLAEEDMVGAEVRQTKPKPRKLESSPYDVGRVIADIIVRTRDGREKYLSIKNIAGATFGNHGYGGGFKQSKIDGYIEITPGTGPGSTEEFITALGIDKETAAQGLTNYANRRPDSPKQAITQPSQIDPETIKSWLASGIGFGYYYVKESPGEGFSVTHLETAQDALDFIGDVTGVRIRYPQGPEVSKQVNANISTTRGEFRVEIRNSSGALLPNELKLKVIKRLVEMLVRHALLTDHRGADLRGTRQKTHTRF